MDTISAQSAPRTASRGRRLKELIQSPEILVAPGVFVMQAVARWGNFFNQELYGPPTDLPWGIPIQCAYRVTQWPCDAYPEATTGFQPLFL